MLDPRILVVTSCTGEKRCKPDNQLALEDFKDPVQLQKREAELAAFACTSGQMYTGMQHLRLMEGVQLLRQTRSEQAVDVVILSAGYGLIPENRSITPYEVTFNTMKGHEVDAWAQFLGVHSAFEQTIQEYDLIFLLLGDNYLRSL
ncbi:MAG: queuine/archaeosine tRNA-ribosyltransferase, partial [Microcoleus sp. SIO2G3]|nr:queuine/archaeosine tRNA-ribosyltransferase [Microcoleus sp. SIO2G3]